VAKRRAQEPALDLSASDSALDLWRRRYFDGDLPAALSVRAFERGARAKVSAEDRAFGLHAWRHRALDEYRSQVVFTEFLADITALGCSHDVITASVRLVRDEARHVEICRRMVVALGGADRIPGEPGWVATDPDAPLLERVLTTTFGTLCIGETLSVALLVKARDVATFPLARAALEQLAKDESIHSQLGWRLLPMLWPAAAPRARRKLVRVLPELMEAAWSAIFGGIEPGARTAERDPFGDVLDGERQAVFDHALEHDILRRFEALGIPARRAAKQALAGKPRLH
jgi:hypothetical protein